MASFYSNLTESLYENRTLTRSSGENGRFYSPTKQRDGVSTLILRSRKKSFYFSSYFATNNDESESTIERVGFEKESSLSPEKCNKFEEFQKSVIEKQKLYYTQLLDAILETSNEKEESYESAVPSGNIILDMDGTLGDNIPARFIENPERFHYAKPIPRPGLRKFFRYVFAHYERVSIWTAAMPEWYALFKQEVLLPNMPPGAKFHFERTRLSTDIYVPLKPLSDIYAKYPEYTSENTTIVDDNVATFQDNRENAVHITAFFYDRMGPTPEIRKKNAVKDRGLYTTIEVLQSRRILQQNNHLYSTV
jgi:hypothetical protein